MRQAKAARSLRLSPLLSLGGLLVVVALCLGADVSSTAVTVSYVEGSATISPAGGSAAVALSEGRTVAAGDRIDTGGNGSVELTLSDESIVRIGPESQAIIREAGYVETTKKSSTVFSLICGKIRAVVAPLVNKESIFLIETENATVGVRGTDFVVSHDRGAGETDVLCSDGSVELRPKDVVRKGLAPILVKGDEGIRLIRGKLPEKPARWVDDRRKRLLWNLEFRGKRNKEIMERRLKYLQHKVEDKGESVVDRLEERGEIIKDRTSRTIHRIFRH